MNTTHFVIMNNMNTINMMHIMNHNTTGTVCNITGVDVVIIVVGCILLIWGGVKGTEWLFDKTYHMKEPWGSIMFIGGIFSYILIGVIIIGLLVFLI